MILDEVNLRSNERFVGRVLKKDVFNSLGVVIATAKTELNSEQLRDMIKHRIILNVEDIEPAAAFGLKSHYQHIDLINETVKQFGILFEEMRFMKQIPLLEIRKLILPAIQEVTYKPKLFALLATLQSNDDYLYRHSMAVGIIATLIGQWMGLSESLQVQLTLAATLHDVGKLKVPVDIQSKSDSLTKEEFEVMKLHTMIGYKMVQETVGMNQRQALAVLQHHERQNGSGYPSGLMGEEIDLFSRIIAVADVFHAMTSNRNYRRASTFFEMMRHMQHQAFGILDPVVVHVFQQHTLKMMVGQDVLLSNGSSGKIVLINPYDTIRPLIRTEEGFQDLSRESNLAIEQVIA